MSFLFQNTKIILCHTFVLPMFDILLIQGCGCGSVGREIASNFRSPRFESSHRQKIILNIYCQLFEKAKIKKNRPGMARF